MISLSEKQIKKAMFISPIVDMENVDLTILENGEHWFHTEEQISFLDSWFEKSICSNADNFITV